MSTLKKRIRLQQARTEFDRGLLTEEQFAAVEIECTTDIIDGVLEPFQGEPVAGRQILETNEALLKPAVVARPKAVRTPKAKVSPDNAGDNLGNA